MHNSVELTIDSIVVRIDNTVDAEVDDDIVALNLDTGTSYGLNSVGARIWKRLAEPTRVSDLCASLVAHYDVEPATCAGQVLELLGQLQSESLLKVTTAPSISEG